MKYILVRIKTSVWILFEKDFLNNNEFRTQNMFIYVLGQLFDKEDFDVNLIIEN